jgi:hypothetical protein
MKTRLAIMLSVVLTGALAASQLSAQTTIFTPLPVVTPAVEASASAPIAPTTASVQNVVEITRLVPAGTSAVTAFTVPAGVVLVVTDVVITNTGTAATCGGAVNRAGTAAAPGPPTPPAPDATTTSGSATTTVAGTLTQTDSTVTGPLCVPAQTTTALPLTTGIEFAAGQSVQLLNAPDPGAGAGVTAGALGFHLRGVLVTLT